MKSSDKAVQEEHAKSPGVVSVPSPSQDKGQMVNFGVVDYGKKTGGDTKELIVVRPIEGEKEVSDFVEFAPTLRVLWQGEASSPAKETSVSSPPAQSPNQSPKKVGRLVFLGPLMFLSL
jgi:hypothetical protein